MKVLSKLEAREGIWMTEAPLPQIGAHDVLIEIKKTAICGTDIHIYNWDEWAQSALSPPVVIGHEFVGVISELGKEVRGFKVGDRVSGEGHLTCGICRNCRAGRRHFCRNTIGVGIQRAGCFAEYLSLPAVNVFQVPDDIDDLQAAVFDPLGNAVHTALSYDLVGEDVVITGAGPIGLMAVAIARHVGARHVVVTDVNEYRLSLAKQMGASLTVNVQHQLLSEAMDQLKMKEGFDVGLEMSGNPQAFQSLLEAMNYGGHVALLGIPPQNTVIDWNHVIFKSLKIKGVYGREIFETWYKMSSMLQSGLDISSAITHQFPVDDFLQAFHTMRSGQSGKVILNWKL